MNKRKLNGNSALLLPEPEVRLEFVQVWTQRLPAGTNLSDQLSLLEQGHRLLVYPTTGLLFQAARVNHKRGTRVRRLTTF